MRVLLTLLCLGSAAAGAQSPAAPQAPLYLETVLDRAGRYVADFQTQASGLVVEERYVQQTYAPPQFNRLGRLNFERFQRRELKSDLLIVRPLNADYWVQFRDVFEVDGRPVRDRTDRLAKLFLQPAPTLDGQVERIVAESARYNIGHVQRNINMPVLPLLVLDPSNQRRFRFARVPESDRERTRNPFADGDHRSDVAASTELWVVQFKEEDRPTLVRGGSGRDMPASGRLWVEATTGRVMVTELVLGDLTLTATIDVSYRLEASLNRLVPAEMREQYVMRADGSKIDGTATYGSFRRFTVDVDEKIADLDGQSESKPTKEP